MTGSGGTAAAMALGLMTFGLSSWVETTRQKLIEVSEKKAEEGHRDSTPEPDEADSEMTQEDRIAFRREMADWRKERLGWARDLASEVSKEREQYLKQMADNQSHESDPLLGLLGQKASATVRTALHDDNGEESFAREVDEQTRISEDDEGLKLLPHHREFIARAHEIQAMREASVHKRRGSSRFKEEHKS